MSVQACCQALYDMQSFLPLPQSEIGVFQNLICAKYFASASAWSGVQSLPRIGQAAAMGHAYRRL